MNKGLFFLAWLLPLPDHLNRHVRYRLREPGQDKITSRPFTEIFNDPMVLHKRFLQYKRELTQLLDHIDKKKRKRACNKTENPCSFYRHFFADVVRVSYLGFSLGGATMLCDFLDSQVRLNACFLLNPAIKLPEINGQRLVGRLTCLSPLLRDRLPSSKGTSHTCS
jgi:hypothetical protein